eukprot:CAMPEP_0168178892 /NCGR_PEP_ID=MMETSP0139_2-20121125/9454_1 /TAXON_ID=44445 /ORGANISM="Pseudo-nitzschia australis, Strain 10249 10 AB" /LENGTH=444 /DNA_ID=CAMNT_0008098489 /DNA_START=186 /DNA_END=1520 /DNA_ORIENTATION=+
MTVTSNGHIIRNTNRRRMLRSNLSKLKRTDTTESGDSSEIIENSIIPSTKLGEILDEEEVVTHDGNGSQERMMAHESDAMRRRRHGGGNETRGKKKRSSGHSKRSTKRGRNRKRIKEPTSATPPQPINWDEGHPEAANDSTNELSVTSIYLTEKASGQTAATLSPGSTGTNFPSSTPTFSPTTFSPTTLYPTELAPTSSPTSFPKHPTFSPKESSESSFDLELTSVKRPPIESDLQTRDLEQEIPDCEAPGNKRRCNKTSGCSWARDQCITTPSTAVCSKWSTKRVKCRRKGCKWNQGTTMCSGVDILASSHGLLAQTGFPSWSPSIRPTAMPSLAPTYSPTTLSPTDLQASSDASDFLPTYAPTTLFPTFSPTTFPPIASSSTTDTDGASPTFSPTTFPPFPSSSPTFSPTTFPPAFPSSPVDIDIPGATNSPDEDTDTNVET